jgi:hypothetical protein
MSALTIALFLLLIAGQASLYLHDRRRILAAAPWTERRTHRECCKRGHPMYGPAAPGWPGAPDRCLCGDVMEPVPS